MAKLPKVTQRVECGLPGYESVFIDVWVNAPQRVFVEWQRLREQAIERDENGVPLLETDADGNPVLDAEFQPEIKENAEKAMKAALYFLQNLVVNFSVDEDEEGRPLHVTDEDFLDRVPIDLITWLFNAVTSVVNSRKNSIGSGVRLSDITGR